MRHVALAGAMIGLLMVGCASAHKAFLILSGEVWSWDGPIFGISGGALSGPVVGVPGDWSVTDARSVVEVEVRPAAPYSVILLCVALGDTLYVASGSGASATWVQALGVQPELRLRVDGRIYELEAARVTDTAEVEAYLAGLREKYGPGGELVDFLPEDTTAEPSAVLFRLSGRNGIDAP